MPKILPQLDVHFPCCVVADSRLFVISPEGGDIARAVSPTNMSAIKNVTPPEETFVRGLMGASRRPLREIFGGDTIELNKVMRFFEA